MSLPWTNVPSVRVKRGGKYPAGPIPYFPARSFSSYFPKNFLFEDDLCYFPKVALGALGNCGSIVFPTDL